MARWARDHERAFLSLFLGGGLIVLAFATIDHARDGNARLIIGTFAGTLAVAVVALWLRHRQGKLILRKAADRERQAETNQRSLAWTPLIVGIVVAVGAAGGDLEGVFVAFILGLWLPGAPLLLWIAFKLRPDQHPGEDL